MFKTNNPNYPSINYISKLIFDHCVNTIKTILINLNYTDGVFYNINYNSLLIDMYNYNCVINKYNMDVSDNKLNNKIENLRPSNLITNGYNAKISKRNKSRIKGVYWHNLMKKWAVQLSIDGKQKKLGYFENLKDAEILVKKMREQHHKEFANHG